MPIINAFIRIDKQTIYQGDEMKLLPVFVMILILQSCSTFMPYRSFEDKMYDNESSFFTPDEDFHVVAGDVEQGRASMADILRRTPASAEEERQFSINHALENELKGLEESQTTEGYYHYLEYKDRLETTSDRIYFLRLGSLSERNNYLYGKGHYNIAAPSHPSVSEAVEDSEIVVGMNKQDVAASWGRPSRVDVDGNPGLENERWTFFYQGRLKYVYFERGLVQGWDIDQ